MSTQQSLYSFNYFICNFYQVDQQELDSRFNAGDSSPIVKLLVQSVPPKQSKTADNENLSRIDSTHTSESGSGYTGYSYSPILPNTSIEDIDEIDLTSTGIIPFLLNCVVRCMDSEISEENEITALIKSSSKASMKLAVSKVHSQQQQVVVDSLISNADHSMAIDSNDESIGADDIVEGTDHEHMIVSIRESKQMRQKSLSKLKSNLEHDSSARKFVFTNCVSMSVVHILII